MLLAGNWLGASRAPISLAQGMEVTVNKSANYALIGLVIGAGVGAALGLLTHNTILGLAGPGVGFALGLAFDASKAKRDVPPDA